MVDLKPKELVAAPSAKPCPLSKHFPQSCPNIRHAPLETERCRFLLCDFGIAANLNRRQEFEIEEGDERYLPPEFVGNFDQGQLDLTKKDIFGIGMIGFQMATLKDLPNRNSNSWADFRNKTNQSVWLHGTSFSSKLQSTILDCLSPNPGLRPSAKTLIKSLHCLRDTHSVSFLRNPLNPQLQLSKIGPQSSCQKPLSSHLWKSSSASKCHHIRYKPSPTGIEEVVSQNSNSSGRN